MDIHLFDVASCRDRPEGVALYPGVPIERMGEPGIGEMIQGCTLELDLPDGTRRAVIMTHYFIEGVVDPDTQEFTVEVPNVVVVVDDGGEGEVPVGTRVLLVGTAH